MDLMIKEEEEEVEEKVEFSANFRPNMTQKSIVFNQTFFF